MLATYGLPIAVTLALWWASTVAILYLDGLPRRTFVWSMAGASALLVAAAAGVHASLPEATPAGAYLAFAGGLTAFGWQLISFYMGFVTGPRKDACDETCTGFARFVEALKTSLYHELTVCLMAAALLAVSWDQPNRFALWTFVVLWWMHQSAKLNVFFGVQNLALELLPAHLRYLASFMRQRPMNLFFPISVSISTIVTVLLAQRAGASEATEFEVVGFTMLATLMALAVLEHWFLVAPLDTRILWAWGEKPGADAASASPQLPPSPTMRGLTPDHAPVSLYRTPAHPADRGHRWAGRR